MKHAIAVAVLTAMLSVSAGAADIHLRLDNNVEVRLHDDHSWTASGGRAGLAGMSIILEDGREVHLGADGRWQFVVDGDGDESEGLAMLYHTGSSKGSDARAAVEHARGRALDGISRRLRALMPPATSLAEIRTCVEEMDKVVEHEEKLVKGIYEVKVTIKLDRGGIAAVKECVELSKRLKERMRQAAEEADSR